MLRLSRSEEEDAKCDGYAKSSPFWRKEKGGYWCEDAAVISPYESIKKMASGADLYEKIQVEEFFYEDECWNIGDVRARHLVLASGAKLLHDEPYLYIKAIFGQKIEAESQNGFDFALHRKCSVSPLRGGKVQVGASHIPNWRYKQDEELFAEHRNKLIAEAEELLGGKINVISESRGFRSATMDFFPYCGQVINAYGSILKIPNLIHGFLPSKKEFVYRPNLWLHQGHGARGFVLAPYTAAHLIKQILGRQSDEESIGLERAFLRYVRKAKI
jgi:tRNA 5-methylaminomethyl-2-thiouridine biosynthesis bifunctional protein